MMRRQSGGGKKGGGGDGDAQRVFAMGGMCWMPVFHADQKGKREDGTTRPGDSDSSDWFTWQGATETEALTVAVEPLRLLIQVVDQGCRKGAPSYPIAPRYITHFGRLASQPLWFVLLQKIPRIGHSSCSSSAVPASEATTMIVLQLSSQMDADKFEEAVQRDIGLHVDLLGVTADVQHPGESGGGNARSPGAGEDISQRLRAQSLPDLADPAVQSAVVQLLFHEDFEQFVQRLSALFSRLHERSGTLAHDTAAR